MPKVIILKGLPASGKTTYAKKLVTDHPGEYKRINKDELRLMFDNGIWNDKNEAFVEEMRDFLVTFSLIEGYSVIIDDTNFNPKHEKRIRELVEQNNNTICLCDKKVNATVEIKDFTDVPLETCIERDKNRDRAVGEAVIRGMYNQYLKT